MGNILCRNDVEFLSPESILNERTDFLKDGINNISLSNGDIETIKLEYFPYNKPTQKSLLAKAVNGKYSKILNPIIDRVTGYCYKLTPMSPIKVVMHSVSKSWVWIGFRLQSSGIYRVFKIF